MLDVFVIRCGLSIEYFIFPLDFYKKTISYSIGFLQKTTNYSVGFLQNYCVIHLFLVPLHRFF